MWVSLYERRVKKFILMTWPAVSQVYALNFLSAPPANLFFLTPTTDTAADKTNNLRPMDKPGYIGKIIELRISHLCRWTVYWYKWTKYITYKARSNKYIIWYFRPLVRKKKRKFYPNHLIGQILLLFSPNLFHVRWLIGYKNIACQETNVSIHNSNGII